MLEPIPDPATDRIAGLLEQILSAINSLDLVCLAKVTAATRVAERAKREKVRQSVITDAQAQSDRMLAMVRLAGERGLEYSVMLQRFHCSKADLDRIGYPLLGAGKIRMKYGKRGGLYYVIVPDPSPPVTPT
jgi:hypothetical protein